MLEKKKPGKIYKSVTSDYSVGWYEDYLSCAYYDLAKDDEGSPLPFLVIMGLYGGEIIPDEEMLNYQKVVRTTSHVMTICVFNSNDEMDEFLGWFDEEKCTVIERV